MGVRTDERGVRYTPGTRGKKRKKRKKKKKKEKKKLDNIYEQTPSVTAVT